MSQLSPQERILLIKIGVTVVVILSVLAAFWWMTGEVSANAIRVWAIVATLAIPLVALITFQLGRVESRGYMRGADHVMERVVGLVNAVTTIREPKPDSRYSVVAQSALSAIAPPTIVLNDPAGFAMIARQVGYDPLGTPDSCVPELAWTVMDEGE
jgi:hypothetical protein